MIEDLPKLKKGDKTVDLTLPSYVPPELPDPHWDDDCWNPADIERYVPYPNLPPPCYPEIREYLDLTTNYTPPEPVDPDWDSNCWVASELETYIPENPNPPTFDPYRSLLDLELNRSRMQHEYLRNLPATKEKQRERVRKCWRKNKYWLKPQYKIKNLERVRRYRQKLKSLRLLMRERTQRPPKTTLPPDKKIKVELILTKGDDV